MDVFGLRGKARSLRAVSKNHSTRLRDRSTKRSVIARRCVERWNTERPLAVKVVNKAGIHLRGQGAHIVNTSTDKLVAGFMDEDLHFLGPSFFIGAPDIYEPGLCEFAGVVVFPLRGRDPVLILATVFVTEDSQVNITTFHLIEVDLVGTTVAWREAPQRERPRK